ncbi:putative ubiquitinyl hydrolase 1 [Helianthus annuus]|nr:putative ubiquitinyl hydrolase 1 [Helianthus annuus]
MISCFAADMFISKRKHDPAHYMLKIESFSLLSEANTSKIESDIFEASGHKWRLDLYPNGNGEDNDCSHISLYVVICNTDSCSQGWDVCVDVTFYVYDHIHHNFVTFQDVNGHGTRFHGKKKTWGFGKLISLESFMESKNGYLFNDSCVFGVEVTAVPESTKMDRCLSMTKLPTTMNTYIWTIDDFSALPEQALYSEAFKLGKMKWKLSLFPKGPKVGKGTHLSIYLGVHDAALLPDGWKVYAKYKIRVKCQGTGSDIQHGTTNGWFNNAADSWGFPSFMPLSQLMDFENDFLLDDTLIVEVEVSVMGMLRNFI